MYRDPADKAYAIEPTMLVRPGSARHLQPRDGGPVSLSAADPATRRQNAQATIRKFTIGAGATGMAAGAIPLPVPDAFVLVPLQITMLNTISAQYDLPGIEIEASVIVSLYVTGVTTYVGRVSARGGRLAAKKLLGLVGKKLSRYVPVLGTIASAAICGAVAASVTASIGTAWIQVCEWVVQHDTRKLDEFLQSPTGRQVMAALASAGLGAYVAQAKRELATRPLRLAAAKAATAVRAAPAMAPTGPAPTPAAMASPRSLESLLHARDTVRRSPISPALQPLLPLRAGG